MPIIILPIVFCNLVSIQIIIMYFVIIIKELRSIYSVSNINQWQKFVNQHELQCDIYTNIYINDWLYEGRCNILLYMYLHVAQHCTVASPSW